MMFSTLPKQNLNFSSTFMLSANVQILSFGKGFNAFVKCSIPTKSAYNYDHYNLLCLANCLTHSHTMTPFDASGKQAFRKHCRKRRNCLEQAISPFPTVFSTRLDNLLPFSSSLKLSSANPFSLEESKICRLVMG